MPRMNQTVVKKANSDSSKQSSKQSSRRKSAGTKKSTEKTSNKQSDSKQTKQNKKKRTSNIQYFTHDGHALTVLEAKFIDIYLETGNGRQSVIEAGYTTKAPGQYATTINLIKFKLKKVI